MAKKKKILYVITKSNWGGAQRYVFDLATSLPSERFKVTVAAGGNGPFLQKLKQAGVKTVPIPNLERDISVLKELLSLTSLFKILRRERPDIIHLNSSKIGGLGAIAAFVSKPITKNYKLKTIFTVHGWGFHEPRPRWQKSFILFLSRLAGLFQSHLIHVSRHDLAATHALGVCAPGNAEYIPLAVNHCTPLNPSRSREFLSKKTGIEEKSFWIGTVAELTKNKGLAYLIDSINEVRKKNPEFKIQVLIIGEGEERERLQNQIRKLGLENTVHLAGFIPDAARYLKAFDIFILPSLKEGLPYTLLEAINAKIPVIATAVGGIPDLIEHEQDGLLVPPANSSTLTKAITTLLVDSEKRRIFAENAAKKIRERNSFSEMIQKHVALYLN
ncbi:MAG: glycosyltransferase family 4 protein [Candidatus Sungbacteria bacterium]|nr:glycosyltransferase family 4 protein [Candidatus Sungbacteria bacterium]